MLVYNELTVVSGFYFYAAYLKTKLQTGSQFKKSALLVTAKTVVSTEAFGQGVDEQAEQEKPEVL
jgi:hypothetical protein